MFMFAGAFARLELGYMEADNKPSEISSATLSSSDKTLGQKGWEFISLCASCAMFNHTYTLI